MKEVTRKIVREVFSNNQLLAIFGFVVFTFVVFSVFMQVQQTRLAETQEQLHLVQEQTAQNYDNLITVQQNSCEGGNLILAKFNVSMQRLAEAERQFQDDVELAKARIEIYEQAQILPLRDCDALILPYKLGE